MMFCVDILIQWKPLNRGSSGVSLLTRLTDFRILILNPSYHAQNHVVINPATNILPGLEEPNICIQQPRSGCLCLYLRMRPSNHSALVRVKTQRQQQQQLFLYSC